MGHTVKRRSYTPALKRQLVAESLDRDVTVAQIARRHGVNANALFNWRKDVRYNGDLNELGGQTQAPVFFPVAIEPDGAVDAASGARPAVDAGAGPIEIALMCGTRLRVRSDIEADALSRVIRAIGAAA